MSLRCIACNDEKFFIAGKLRALTLLKCDTCGLWAYDASAHHVDRTEDEFAGLDLEAYYAAMEQIRHQSSRRLLDVIEKHITNKGRMLDIGCSFGWFLDVAAERGWQTFGIEPSEIAIETARAGKHQLLHGEFPAAHFPGEQFDVVAMMDVLEHLPHGHDALREINKILRPGGLLVLKVPNRNGGIYRAATLLYKATCGLASLPLWRLWQLDFPYPHVWYFEPRQLRQALERAGFENLQTDFEPIVTLASIPHRIRYIRATGSSGSAFAAPVYRAGLSLCALLDQLRTERDILIQFARKP
ncbi:class I SAM-dependent methyltransferase [Candidatus Sumerlaeota bacterium]|nr:class I SAM-dependent methyltransferase [Candidatus Sumerlaeota bacterium]